MPWGTHFVVSMSLKSDVCCQALRPVESVVILWLPSLKISATETRFTSLAMEATFGLSFCSTSLKSAPFRAFSWVLQLLGSSATAFGTKKAAVAAKMAEESLILASECRGSLGRPTPTPGGGGEVVF